jgi:heme exporter protein B
MLRNTIAILRKDFKIELRSKILISQVIPIVGALIIVFGFAFGPSKEKLQSVSAGMVWIAIVLATLFVAQRIFAQEAQNDAKENLLALAVDSSEIFLAKSILSFIEITSLGIITFGAVLAISSPQDMTLKACGLALIGLFLGGAALAFLSTLYGAITFLSASKDTLMPLLFLPAASPILLSATELTNPLFGGSYPPLLTWAGLLLLMTITYLAVGLIAFEGMVEEQ